MALEYFCELAVLVLKLFISVIKRRNGVILDTHTCKFSAWRWANCVSYISFCFASFLSNTSLSFALIYSIISPLINHKGKVHTA